MAEYIEREAAVNSITAIMPSMSTPDGCGERDDLVLAAQEMCVDAMQEINNIPAADVAPVVHGRWIPERHKDRVSQTEYHSYIWYHCSECGRRLIGYRDPREAPFCHCGTKMDLRGENDDGSEKA